MEMLLTASSIYLKQNLPSSFDDAIYPKEKNFAIQKLKILFSKLSGHFGIYSDVSRSKIQDGQLRYLHFYSVNNQKQVS